MSCVCKAAVSVRNPYTSWESVRFVHDVHQVFAVTISNFYHTLHVSNEDSMQSFISFRSSFSRYFVPKRVLPFLVAGKSVNAAKIENQLKKCSNLSMGLWTVCSNHKKSLRLK